MALSLGVRKRGISIAAGGYPDDDAVPSANTTT